MRIMRWVGGEERNRMTSSEKRGQNVRERVYKETKREKLGLTKPLLMVRACSFQISTPVILTHAVHS